MARTVSCMAKQHMMEGLPQKETESSHEIVVSCIDKRKNNVKI